MHKNSKREQFCPICNIAVPFVARYPAYLCDTCTSKTHDGKGRRVYFANTSIGGGCQGYYQDDGSRYNHRVCYVGEVRCMANEARFGGIVVQMAKPKA